jgi:hypothetical protein
MVFTHCWLTIVTERPTVETALEALTGIDNVTVSGNAGGPYTITFGGTQANKNVASFRPTPRTSPAGGCLWVAVANHGECGVGAANEESGVSRQWLGAADQWCGPLAAGTAGAEAFALSSGKRQSWTGWKTRPTVYAAAKADCGTAIARTSSAKLR